MLLLRAAGIACAFLLHLAAARVLGPADYGLYSYIIGWLSILTTVVLFGQDTAAIRFVAVYTAQASPSAVFGFLVWAVRNVFVVAVTISVTVVALVWFLENRNANVWTMAALMIFAWPVAILCGSILLGRGESVASQLFQPLIRPALVAFLVFSILGPGFSDAGLIDVISIEVVVSLCIAILLLVVVVTRVRSPDHWSDLSSRQEWRISAIGLFLVTIIQTSLGQLDVLVLGWLRSDAEVGVFSAALRVTGVLSLMLASMNVLAAPRFAAMFRERNLSGLQRLAKAVARRALLFTMFGTLGLFLWGKTILNLFGPSFVAGYEAMLILSLGQIANSFAGSVVYVLTMAGRQREGLSTMAGVFLLSVGVSVALIREFGVDGAVWSSVICMTMWNVALMYKVRKEIGIDTSVLPASTLAYFSPEDRGSDRIEGNGDG